MMIFGNDWLNIFLISFTQKIMNVISRNNGAMKINADNRKFVSLNWISKVDLLKLQPKRKIESIIVSMSEIPSQNNCEMIDLMFIGEDLLVANTALVFVP